MHIILLFSEHNSSWAPGVFYTYFYNRAHHLFLENYHIWGFLEVPAGILNHFWIQVPVSLLKPPRNGYKFMTVICNAHSPTDTTFGCNGHVTAMAVGQRQRLYSGVRMFTGNYLSSTPRALRVRGAKLELCPLTSDMELYDKYNIL
jgi:hypothetical protein